MHDVRVVIAGGSGLIGRRLAVALQQAGDEAVVLSRRPTAHTALTGRGLTVMGWDPGDLTASWADTLRGADAVVNLAGSSVGAWPWTKRRMEDLVESRMLSTTALVDAIGRLPSSDRPLVFISASGTDIYEGNDSEPATEDSEPADTFLARLCTEWESVALRAEDHAARVVLTRMSLVVDREAPALKRLALPVKMFAGGRLGSGQQWISWIHISDVLGLMRLALERGGVRGPVNFASPDPHRQVDFSREIARQLHRPFRLPTPAAAVRLALGRQSTLALGSRRVSPARALALGYEFNAPTLEDALSRELGSTV